MAESCTKKPSRTLCSFSGTDLHKAVLLLKYHEEIHFFRRDASIRPNPSEKMLKIGLKRVVIFNNLNYQRYLACCLSERLRLLFRRNGADAGVPGSANAPEHPSLR